jgi:DNA-binding Xre family transcriptional regulator
MPGVHHAPYAAAGTLPARPMPPGRTVATVPSLRHWRVQRAREQQDLAHDAGVSLATVKRAEAGRAVGLGIIGRLADALGVTPTELMQQPPEQRL